MPANPSTLRRLELAITTMEKARQSLEAANTHLAAAQTAKANAAEYHGLTYAEYQAAIAAVMSEEGLAERPESRA